MTRLTLSECLDECNRGDVLVVRPASGRRRDARPVWLERIAGDELTQELENWLTDGGPGRAPTPESFDPHIIDRSNRTPS
ncbi:hypothetical protein [Cellulomonas sp. Leaf395]|uniref:hypothetical protein n=1 Tax=Cellulomonas sp. Leaf395 TaxID=1736362 RepID=UPI001F45354A|nr:hypothetical protein [Cellulomonas sp. Leaf395]